MRTSEELASLAESIWANDPDYKNDHLRWHSSGHHIAQKSLSVADLMENAHECLLFADCEECQLDISNVELDALRDDLQMIIAMAKVLWQNLKEYGRYAFEQEPDWEQAAKKHLEDNV